MRMTLTALAAALGLAATAAPPAIAGGYVDEIEANDYGRRSTCDYWSSRARCERLGYRYDDYDGSYDYVPDDRYGRRHGYGRYGSRRYTEGYHDGYSAGYGAGWDAGSRGGRWMGVGDGVGARPDQRWVDYCSSRYDDYDPRTDTYVDRDGRVRRCR